MCSAYIKPKKLRNNTEFFSKIVKLNSGNISAIRPRAVFSTTPGHRAVIFTELNSTVLENKNSLSFLS